MNTAITQAGDNWAQYAQAIRDNQKYDESVKETLLWSVGKARREGWSLGRMAEEVDSSSTVLSRIYKGIYGAKIDKQVATIKNYQSLCEARDRQGNLPDFVMTPVAKRIFSMANYAYHRGGVVNVIGKTQRGKTHAIEEYARRTGPNVIVVRCPAIPSPSRLLRRIAWAMGSEGMLALDYSQDYIMRRLSSKHLLVIDEIHHVVKLETRIGQQSVELLREIRDLSKCGLLLIGTEIWDEAMYRNDKWIGVLSQLVGRGRTMRIKQMIPVDDLRKMWTHYGLPEPDDKGKAIVSQMANDEGLKHYTDALCDGRNMAINRGVPYTWDLFLEAIAVRSKVEQGN